jgi:Ala-tRNA(Pro) deacylase
MTDINEQKLYEILNLLGVKYIRYQHEPIYTIEEANQLDVYIPGQQCKNLFLRNRKGDIHYLLIADEAKQIDLKFLSKQIGSTNLSFASEDRLYKYMGIRPGSVSPFGLINDIEAAVIVLIDKDLIDANTINFHPNVNTATISISYADFEKFIKWHKNKLIYININ